ncbi:MAG: hypothetical protein II743_04465, partial [Lachnospiraceae bacterium]|nr:hypothetical protein [Lachnospiraceae bacterium]
MFGGKKLKIGWMVAMVCMIPLIISSFSTVTTLLMRSKLSCEESVYRQMDLILDDRIAAIQNYINGAETYMRQYGTAPVIKEMLVALDRGERVKFEMLQPKAQAYTEEYFANLSGWEGVYASNWDTVVQVHSNQGAVGMQTRKGDALAPYRATMTDSKD